MTESCPNCSSTNVEEVAFQLSKLPEVIQKNLVEFNIFYCKSCNTTFIDGKLIVEGF